MTALENHLLFEPKEQMSKPGVKPAQAKLVVSVRLTPQSLLVLSSPFEAPFLCAVSSAIVTPQSTH